MRRSCDHKFFCLAECHTQNTSIERRAPVVPLSLLRCNCIAGRKSIAETDCQRLVQRSEMSKNITMNTNSPRAVSIEPVPPWPEHAVAARPAPK